MVVCRVGSVRTVERTDIIQGYGVSFKDSTINICEIKGHYKVEVTGLYHFRELTRHFEEWTFGVKETRA